MATETTERSDGPRASDGLWGILKYHCFVLVHSCAGACARAGLLVSSPPPPRAHRVTHAVRDTGLLRTRPPSLMSQVAAACGAAFVAVQLLALLLRPEFGWGNGAAFGVADFVLARGAPSAAFHAAFAVVVGIVLFMCALAACAVVLLKYGRNGATFGVLALLLRWLCALVLDVLLVPVLVIMLIPLNCTRMYSYARRVTLRNWLRGGTASHYVSCAPAALARASRATPPTTLRVALSLRS